MTAKAEKPKKKMPKRPRQQMIPGTQPEQIPELTQAAEEYVEYRDARMDAGRMESKCAEKLLELMKTHNLRAYEFDGMIVELGALEKIKVRKLKGGDENGDS